MQKCGKTDHAGTQEIQKQITLAKAAIQHADDRQTYILENISKSKHSFLDLLKNSPEHDIDVLERERIALRPDAEATVQNEIREKTGRTIQATIYDESRKTVDQELENQ